MNLPRSPLVALTLCAAVCGALGVALVGADEIAPAVHVVAPDEGRAVPAVEPQQAEPAVRKDAVLDAVPAQQASAKGPAASVDSRHFDWGEIPANQPFGHVFVVRNDGDEVLRIHKLRPSCGCAALAYDQEIQPGGEGRIEVRIAGNHLKPGNASVHVEVTCNDARGSFPLLLRGKVTQPVHDVRELQVPRLDGAALLLDR